MDELLKEIGKHDDFVVITHTNPDGDAIGSAVAMYLLLKKLGKTAFLCIDGEAPKKMDFIMAYCENVIPVSGDVHQCAVAVDCGDLSRLGEAERIFNAADRRMEIDHHKTNTFFADVNYMENISATGLLIYDLAVAAGVKIDRAMADCLYVAISTDTGNFSYEATDKRTLECAAVLRGFGADVPYICERMYRTRSLGATKLIGVAIDRIRLFGDGKMAVTYVLLDDYRNTGAVPEDCDDIINYAREIDNVEIAAMLRETGENSFKLSMRSCKYADVAEIVMQFGGGGHIRAAGGRMDGSVEHCIEEIVKASLPHIKG